MRLYLTHLGCKLNQAEVEALGRQAMAAGHSIVADPLEADWAVVNTCAVTRVAERKSCQAIRSLQRRNPKLRVVVTGCCSELPAVTAGALRVERIVPNCDKDDLLSIMQGGKDVCGEGTYGDLLATHPLGRTRTFVKIQDGCNNGCTYCFVRFARGPQRSRPPEEILREIETRLAEGYQEIVLTGVNIGAYGCAAVTEAALPQQQGWSLARLIRYILHRLPVPRLRLSSIEPQDLTDDLVSLWPDPRLCRHVHLPLQSGSDAILSRMGRGYDTAFYAQRVSALRAVAPQIAITADVMVGFPGESSAHFAETLSFVRDMGLARLHVFRFSPRPGTKAASMHPRVAVGVARERSRELIELAHELARSFHQDLVGSKVNVLFERAKRTSDGLLWEGLTDNNVRVLAEAEGNLANRLAWASCQTADEHGIKGRVEAVCPRSR